MSHSLKYKQCSPSSFKERLLQILGFNDNNNALFKKSLYLFSHLTPDPAYLFFL